MSKSNRIRMRRQRRLIAAGILFAAVVLVAAVAVLLLTAFGVISFEAQQGTDAAFRSDILQSITVPLGQEIELNGVGRYAGVFFEDGSNETVSDVLMIKITNTGNRDLQLARLCFSYAEFTAEFEVTNLPAGRTVVALEKYRHPYTDEQFSDAELKEVVFFSENMYVDDQRFAFTGMDGALNLKNISGADITGDFYVYYKYISCDTLYGGITFRVKVEGGLKSNEIRQLYSKHFDPDRCMIVHVSAEVS